MKKTILLGVLFLCFGISHVSAQFSVDFNGQPKKVLKSNMGVESYTVKYSAAKKSTIYLELKRGDVTVARGHKVVPKSRQANVTIVLKARKNEKLIPGSNYRYKLYMYAGDANDWSKKICHPKTVNNIKVTASRGKANSSIISNFFK